MRAMARRSARKAATPIGVNLANPDWKEAFLHTRDAYGIVIRACSDFQLCG